MDLTFATDPTGSTYISRQYFNYPYHLCRTLRFEGDPKGMATVYLQSCAGGIFEHDRLWERFVAGCGARAHVTTQSGTIVHGMEGGCAHQDVIIEAGAGALIEFVPDPFILFPGARLTTSMLVRAHETALLIIADSAAFHDPAGGRAMFDRFQNDITVEHEDGRLLAGDRLNITGDMIARHTPGITGDLATFGSLFVIGGTHTSPGLLGALRQSIAKTEGIYGGASMLSHDCGVCLRLLAKDASALRIAVMAAWHAARWELFGAAGVSRRK